MLFSKNDIPPFRLFLCGSLKTLLPIVTLALLYGCVLPLPQTKSIMDASDRSAGAHPPKLSDWQASHPMKFFLVHGMNCHPFTSGTYKGINYLGCNNYTELEMKLINWNSQGAVFQNDAAQAAVDSQYGDFIKYYADRTHLQEDINKRTFKLVWDPDHKWVIGYVFTRSFTPKSGKGYPVDFYVSSWCIHDCFVKEQTYGALDGGKPEGATTDYQPLYENNRHDVNKLLKHDLVEWGLTDASLYVGAMKGEFEWAVAKGIDRMSQDLKPDDQLVIITSSLGSTITYNTLKHLNKHEQIDGQAVDSRSNWTAFIDRQNRKGEGEEAKIAFYMFANQYGLLQSANEIATKVPPSAPNSADTVTTQSETHPATVLGEAFGHGGPAIQLVAFTDPDDLLSFRLAPKKKSHVQITNVVVNNNSMAFGIFLGPIPLTSFTNALNSHTGYDENDRVFDVLYNGIKQ